MGILIRTFSGPYQAPITRSGNGINMNNNVRTIMYNSGRSIALGLCKWNWNGGGDSLECAGGMAVTIDWVKMF